MAQPQTDGIMKMLDPFGFWKTYRDSVLETSSKYMIDMVNSEDYARFTGTFLDQYLSMTQPVQDAVQKAMSSSLAYLNMPTRDEVLSLAERLINIETRLDDLDAQTNDMHDEDHKEIRSVEHSLDKVLNTIMARLDDIEAKISPSHNEPTAKPQSKVEAKPEPKIEAKK